MDWFLKFLVIWLSFDILTLATAWYAVNVIKPRCPTWWKQVIADAEPKSERVASAYQAESPQYYHAPSPR
ncbi:MAG: hypothetical protein U0401_14155 [Anaerolineae bacterium]